MARLFIVSFVNWLLWLLSFNGATAQTIRYVRPGAASIGLSWELASGDLAQMLRLSNPGDEVWVAAGTYVPLRDPTGSTAPSDPRTKTFFVKSGVKVYGGFIGTETSLGQRPNVNPATNPSSTTLSGDIGVAGNHTDNAYHVVSMGASTTATVVDGFVITRGNANGPGAGINIGDQHGGGLLLLSNAAATIQPVLQNLIFANNQAIDSGGGLFAGSIGGSLFSTVTGICSPTIQNCRFVLNQAQNGGGLLLFGAGQPTLFNLLFDRNTASQTGGGASIMGADPDGRNGGSMMVTGNRCDFTSNSAPFGGGITVNTESGQLGLRLTRSSFQFNRAEGLPSGGFIDIGASGGGIFLGSLSSSPPINVNFQNCLISGNTADDLGGGCYLNPGTSLTLTNTTISGNISDKGGAMAGQPNFGNQLAITNSILFANVGVSGNPTLYVFNYDLSGNKVDITESQLATSYLQIRFSDVQRCSTIGGCATNLGNFDEDPLFTAPGLYTLQANSPCVNAGDATSTTATAGAVDFNGAARIQGSVVDAGAWESAFPLTTVYSIRPGLFEDAINWSCQCAPTGKKTVVGHNMSMPSGAAIRSVRFRPGGRIQMTAGPFGNPSRLQLSGGN